MNPKQSSTINNRILHVFLAMGALFIALVLFLSWFELHGKLGIMSNPYNKRMAAMEDRIIRGNIYDRNGLQLTKTEAKENENASKDYTRVYPFKNLYAHLIGFSSKIYGKALLEAKYNDVLLGRDTYGLTNRTNAFFKGTVPQGNNLNLTIDHKLQDKARSLLGKKKGAIIALDPKTGAILAMVSTPDFDVNSQNLTKEWPDLVKRADSPFLPRATMGLYPPGSTFKLITATALIEQGLSETTVTDKGSTEIDGKTFENANNKSNGKTDLKKAITVSSNVYFAELSQELGAKALLETAARIGIGSGKDTSSGIGSGMQSLNFDLPVSQSRVGSLDMGPTELAATAIGQGNLLVSPLHMAMVAAAIANEGVIMAPYLVDHLSRPDLKAIALTEAKPKALGTFTSTETAKLLTEMMVSAVKSGTGKRAGIKGISVAGKTGTAQNEEEGQDHAWFIGFAPAEDPQIAVAVVVEYAGKGGGEVAAPMARDIMNQWLKSKQ